MELARELFVSALLALLLSFLVAKLVSAIVAPHNDADPGTAATKTIVMEELKLRAHGHGRQSDHRVVESVQGESEVVDRFEAGVPEKDSGELQEESEVVDLSAKPSEAELELELEMSSRSREEDVVLETESGFVKELKVDTDLDCLVAQGEAVRTGDGGGGSKELIGAESVTEDATVDAGDKIGEQDQKCEEDEQKRCENEVIGAVSFEEVKEQTVASDEIGVLRLEKEKDGVAGDKDGEEEEVRVDEDDWEGIERSDLEKIFAAAGKYVGSGDHSEELACLGSDVEMELYGLHKVATEGPCRESQPMALRVSARANWVKSCYV